MFKLFGKKQNKVSKVELVIKKERTNERPHRFTEKEDIKLVRDLVAGKRFKDIALDLDVTPQQATNRFQAIKAMGLRVDRLNVTQMIVSMAITSRTGFAKRPNLLKEIEKLIANVVIKRELKFTNEGAIKKSYSTWKPGELRTIKYYKENKSLQPNQIATLLNRPIGEVTKRYNEV